MQDGLRRELSRTVKRSEPIIIGIPLGTLRFTQPTTENSEQVSTGLDAGESRTHYFYLEIPSGLELGTFTFGVKLTDTSGNVIDDDSFEFIVVSGTSSALKRSARRLKRLMKSPEVRVIEGDGWTAIMAPEKGAGSN